MVVARAIEGAQTFHPRGVIQAIQRLIGGAQKSELNSMGPFPGDQRLASSITSMNVWASPPSRPLTFSATSGVEKMAGIREARSGAVEERLIKPSMGNELSR